MFTTALAYSAILLFHSVLAFTSSEPREESYTNYNTTPEPDDGRIVGGILTTIDKHPHQVSLRFKNHHICGGSIISNYWIVTAAHCVQRDMARDFTVKAGSTTLTGDEGVVIGVKEIISHPRYSMEKADYDIALIKLKHPLVYSSKIQPIKLSSWNDNSSESKATVTGWGRIKEGGNISNQLREVSVPIVSNEECGKMYGKTKISSRMICAGYIGVGGKDACQGDSGGPLVRDENLIGIVSWGAGCADIYPGVYTRVTALRSWISKNTDI